MNFTPTPLDMSTRSVLRKKSASVGGELTSVVDCLFQDGFLLLFVMSVLAAVHSKQDRKGGAALR